MKNIRFRLDDENDIEIDNILWYASMQCLYDSACNDVTFLIEEEMIFRSHRCWIQGSRDILRPPSSGVRLRPRDPWFESPTWNKQIEDIELAITTPWKKAVEVFCVIVQFSRQIPDIIVDIIQKSIKVLLSRRRDILNGNEK